MENPATIHLHPTAPLAEQVLLPGDPGRALRLAQTLLEAPVMFNHNRGLWGYTGTAPDGELLTIQSTGMGGPSAAIVIAELSQLGARRLVRIGTCGALDPRLALGDLVIGRQALSRDGTSAALDTRGPLIPDTELRDSLIASAASSSHTATTGHRRATAHSGTTGHRRATAHSGTTGHRRATAHSGTIVSTDLFYDMPDSEHQEWARAGAWAVDMETATLFALAPRRGLRAASLLVVSDVLNPARVRIETEALHAAEQRMGEVAMAALIRDAG